ncbi:MAG: ATP/GTP-binding protein [Chitinophagaceae bacterium]|nr:MAG: ATP/GTP-binding protein [Chitinophagaceae bacterium]
MKKQMLVLGLMLAFSQLTNAQDKKLVKLWQTDSVFKTPESVLYDPANQVLYVTNIDGTDPWGKDDKGSVGKLGLDGKVQQVEWVKGFQSPKGMALYKGTLFVADMDQVVSVDIKKGTITKRLTVEGAGGLNDVAVDARGVLYVSDSKNKKLYKIADGKAELYLPELKGPNGVHINGGKLLIVDNGGLYEVGTDKSLKLIADGMEGGTDGIEHLTTGEYIVSCWAGVIYLVKADGSKEVLLDTRDVKSNTADIGIHPQKQIIYVPTFWKNSVVAYEVK